MYTADSRIPARPLKRFATKYLSVDLTFETILGPQTSAGRWATTVGAAEKWESGKLRGHLYKLRDIYIYIYIYNDPTVVKVLEVVRTPSPRPPLPLPSPGEGGRKRGRG